MSTWSTPPAEGETPSWAEYWATLENEWLLAAREVCELVDRTQAVASGYLRWLSEPTAEGEWWVYPELDWETFGEDLEAGRTTLSSTEKALARVAVALVAGRGVVEFAALDAAGYLGDVLGIVARCSETAGRAE